MASWNVIVDGKNYEIKQKSYSLRINGEKKKLKELMSKKDGIYRVYEVPLGSKKAQYYVNTWVGGAKLAMDGVDCATGQPFTPPKMPKWAYIFMVIHCLNFMNGALGALLAILGVMATISISSNTGMPVVARVLLNILVVVACAVAVFGVALALATVLYS
ncbi:MAG: hypothetical protein HFG74_08105 [Hungatella sp.]|jgi:hypothetical protein|nr:hypothetical protein [Hungatella sp.]